ncbi:uncharacterized protein LOC141705599 [Apium graveolens]|uniref:uncharacterized protein LOC141705599 n=1 Tax=Apium graveolens TaxID=4045 RepID=UPI003D79BC36
MNINRDSVVRRDNGEAQNVLRLRGGMTSQGSDCDSDGVPGYMQDVCEDDGLELIQAQREAEDFPVLVLSGGLCKVLESEADLHFDEEGILSPRSASKWAENQDNTAGIQSGFESSLGGIRLEKETKKVAKEWDSFDDDFQYISDRDRLEHITVSKASKAAFVVRKHEGEELIRARKYIQILQEVITKNGLSIVGEETAEIRKEIAFNMDKCMDRDEFGLPISKLCSEKSRGNDYSKGDKVTVENVSTGVGVSGAKGLDGKEVQDGSLSTNGGLKSMKTKDSEGQMGKSIMDKKIPAGTKTWADVLQKPRVELSKFEFHPPSPGSLVIDPSDDFLKEGLDKLKLCFTGYFSKRSLPFALLQSEANKVWGGGMGCKVSQKNERTFVFRFSSVEAKNKILTKGTWYFLRKPMVLVDYCEDSKSGSKVTKMPIWIKLSNIPDCYWTKDLLGRLAGAVVKPLFSDALTAQLNILPFARFCVEYNAGAPLPDFIEAMMPDHFNGGKCIVKVTVNYQNKPQTCKSCHSLGHVDLVCPSRPRGERKTEKPVVELPVATDDKSATENEKSGEELINANMLESTDDLDKAEIVNVEGWKSIIKGKEVVLDSSPSPITNFKTLKRVDEVDLKLNQGPGLQKLSKSQLKK